MTMRITRRRFLGQTGIAAAGFALAGRGSALEQKDENMKDRPNILFAIADDWSWPHAGVYGDKVIKTPAFDRVAKEGVIFTNAFTAAPTCTASRAAILTGQAPHRLEEGADLWSTLRKQFPVYPDLLEASGYAVGLTGKGWGPGNVEAGGRTRNAAGPHFPSFDEFLKTKPKDKPFCFWFGSHRPHRPYKEGSGIETGLKPADVTAPPYLPDTPETRSDLLDYYEASQQYDHQIQALLDALDASGLAENTILVVTSDNGLPFPRAKANLYDAGTRMPMAVRWPARIKAGRTDESLIGFTDFAPTFLEAAGLEPIPDFTGRSFLDLLLGKGSGGRDHVFLERERHNIRAGGKSYPIRAVRTKDYLYIRNFRPNLLPAGNPLPNDPEGGYADIDGGPTKKVLVTRRDDPKIKPFFEMACAKRPEEELYDVKNDPWQLTDLAADPKHASVKKNLRKTLDEWMGNTDDPRAKGDDDRWDKCEYYGKK